MSDRTEDSLILLEILEVLGACRALVSYADVCVHLSGRYELQPLLELRSLLYSTARRDPCFPATLFRERLHLPCSNRLSAAADVVSLFNLLTHTRLPPSYKDQSLTSCLACDQDRACHDWLRGRGGAVVSGCKYEGSTQKLISYYPPTHLLASVHSGLHTLSQRSMQKAHSLDIPSGPTGNQETDRTMSMASDDVDTVHSCAHKRRVFKGDFHNLLPFVPSENKKLSEQSPEELRAEGKDVQFQACRNPYSDSEIAVTHTKQKSAQKPSAHSIDAIQIHTPDAEESIDAETVYPQKHKSLDDLQSSTYFGPTVIERTIPSPVLIGKSYSLDIDSRPTEASENEIPGLDRAKPQRPRSEKSALDKSGLSKPGLHKISFEGSSFDIPGFDPYIVRSVHDTLKRLSGLSLDGWYDWSPDADGVVSVGTQTDVGDRRALKSLLLSDKLSIDNTDIDEDDISAIFRFLDDISMCGSMAVLPGAAGGPHDGNSVGGLPERRERLGKLRRLFHSLEGPEEGVRWGVGRLLQRVTELEQRLEPISEVRDQLTIVLATLKRLEEREHFVHAYLEPTPVLHQLSPGLGNQHKGDSRASLCVDRAEVAAKRRGLFANPNSRNTASSGSEQHSELNVSYSKEQITLHPSQVCSQVYIPTQQ